MSGRFGPQQQTTARLRSLKPFSRVIMLHVKSVEGYIFLARLRPTDQFGSRGNCQWTQSNHRRSQSLHENLMNPTKRSQSTWSSSTKHQTVTSLVELNLQVAVKRCSVSLGPYVSVRPAPQSSVSLIIATKSQDENLFICLNREFQPRNQFTQLSLSPIARLVLFLLWPLSAIETF